MPAPETHVYATRPSGSLRVYIYRSHEQASTIGTLVFLHGGGWYSGSPSQFEDHAKYFAARNWNAVLVEYRVYGKHGTLPDAAFADAQASLDWLGSSTLITPRERERLVLVGASAGGHLAACLALGCITDERASVDAVVLLNPVLDLQRATSSSGFSSGELEILGALSEDKRTLLSPIASETLFEGPTLIVYGESDPLYRHTKIQLANLSQFPKAHLQLVPGASHGFFNKRPWKQSIINEMQRFLAEI